MICKGRRKGKSDKFSGLFLTLFCLECSVPGICSALSVHLNCLETNWSVYALHWDWHFYCPEDRVFKILLFDKSSWYLGGTAWFCEKGRPWCALRKEEIACTKGVRLGSSQLLKWFGLLGSIYSDGNKCSQMGMSIKAWTSNVGWISGWMLSLTHRQAAASESSSCFSFWVIAKGYCSFSFCSCFWA